MKKKLLSILLILSTMIYLPRSVNAQHVEELQPTGDAAQAAGIIGSDVGVSAMNAAQNAQNEIYSDSGMSAEDIASDVSGSSASSLILGTNTSGTQNVSDTTATPTLSVVSGEVKKDSDSETGYSVEINGKEYDAYCIDKGMKAGVNKDTVCVNLGNSSFGQAFKRLLATTSGTNEDKTAMRYLGILTGLTRDPDASNKGGTSLKNSLIKEIGGQVTLNHSAYTRAIEALFGYSSMDGSISADKAKQLEEEGTKAAGLTFTIESASNGRVTIKITSTTKITQMKFGVEGGSLVSSSWNGKSGTAVISDDDKDCNVALKVAYNGSEAVLCSRNGTQSFIADTSKDDAKAVAADIDDSDTSNTFAVTAESFKKYDGAYYESVCMKVKECEEVSEPHQNLQNCCEDGGIVDVTEPELNDLFCPDDALGVEYFKRRKGSDKYIKTNAKFADNGSVNSLAKKYCTVYCTQRAYIEIPSGINQAKNGLYFELEKGSWGTASAYERGTKRCRVRIDYDAWWTVYDEYVEKEMKAYNEFQENTAIYRYIDDNSDCSHNDHDKRGDQEVCGEPNKQTAEDYFVVCDAHPTSASSSCKGANGESLTCTVTKIPNQDHIEPKAPQKIAYTFADLQHQSDYYYYKLEWDKEKKDVKYERVEVDKKKLNNKVQADSIYSYNSIGPQRVKDLIDERDEAFGQYNGKEVGSKESPEGDCDTCSKPSPPEPKWECQKSHQVIEDYAATDWVDSEEPWEVRKKEYKAKADKASNDFHTYTLKARDLEMALDSCSSYFYNEPDSYELNEVISANNGYDTSKNYKLKSTYAFDYTQIYLDPYGNLQEFVTDVPFSGGCYITPGYEHAGTVKTGAPQEEDGRHDIWPSYYSKNKYNKHNNMEYYDDFSDKKIGKLTVGDEDNKWYKGKQPQKFYEDFLHNKVGEIKGGIFKNDKKFTMDGLYKMECKWDETGANLNTFVPTGSAVPLETSENITFHGKVYSVFLSTLEGTYDTNHHIGCIGENCAFDEVTATGDACAKENGGGGRKPSDESVGESAMSCTLKISYSIVLTGKCNPDDVTARIETCEIFGQDANLFEFKIADPSDILPGYEGLDYADNWKDENGRKAYNQVKADANADKTYAIDHLTYSFIVNPKTMKLIQAYNADAAIDGGYSDFQMQCNCGGHACVRCASNFITKFVNGTLINGSSYKASEVWGNSKMTLNQVRSGNNYVHWKENQ